MLAGFGHAPQVCHERRACIRCIYIYRNIGGSVCGAIYGNLLRTPEPHGQTLIIGKLFFSPMLY